KNISTAPQTGEVGLHTAREIQADEEQKGSLFGGIGNQTTLGCSIGEDMHRQTPGATEGGILGCGGSPAPVKELKGPVHFVDLDLQYFLSALYPVEPRQGRCVMTATPTVRSAEAFFPVTLQPGQSETLKFGAFMGPKDFELLKAASSVGLEHTVDYGLWAVICKVL